MAAMVQLRCRITLLMVLLVGLVLIPLALHYPGLGYPNQLINPREGWAILLEMNDYPGESSDLPTNYNDTQKWNHTLHSLGWQTHHIRIYNGELTRIEGEAALNFIITNADENDVVLCYIFAHSNWIQSQMEWDLWFPSMWASIPSYHKVLVISACNAEAFIIPLIGDPLPQLDIGAAAADEFAWAGLPSEGLPIVGEVFNHYFTAAFLNSSADANADGNVSVEEAFRFASPQSQEYIATVVFPAFPEYALLCNGTSPQPVINDAYPDELSLIVELGDYPGGPSGFNIPLWFISFSVVGVVTGILLIGAIMIWNMRRIST